MKAEATVLRAAWAAAAVGCLATAVLGGWAAALGVGLGAGLGLVNLHWLRAGAHAIVYDAVARTPGVDAQALAALGPQPRFGKTRFLLRFVLEGVALYAIFMSHLVPFPAVLFGLLAAPAGVMGGVTIEAVRGWRRGTPQ